jgi:probable phosphomutase (TIGR03848 family)
MTTVLLVRHGLTAATGAVLSGWTAGVHLDERGRAQVAALGERLLPVPLAAVICSPLERCRETAEAILGGRNPVPPLHVDEQLGEVDYGGWTGRPLRELRKEPLWAVIQATPSAAVFPEGEPLAAMSARAAAAVRRWNADLGPDVTYAVVSHGDVIKAIVADALGLHLDGFQRIVVDPAALSVVRYGPRGTHVERVNDCGGNVAALLPARRRGAGRGSRPAAPGAGRVSTRPGPGPAPGGEAR